MNSEEERLNWEINEAKVETAHLLLVLREAEAAVREAEEDLREAEERLDDLEWQLAELLESQGGEDL